MLKTIKHYKNWIFVIAMMQALSACQYTSLYKEVTDPTWAKADTRSDSVCEALGARRGDSSLDWCMMQDDQSRADMSNAKWQE